MRPSRFNLRSLFGLGRAGFLLARAGAFGFLELDDLPPPARRAFRVARWFEPKDLSQTERGRLLSDAVSRLGPSYIKLGQFLATRPDIVGPDTAEALGGLKDDMPPFPTAQARAIVAGSVGRPVETVFAGFSEPVGAASIAQVHRATLAGAEGPRDVAVKVLRPGVRRRFARDLRTFYAGANFIEANAPETRRLRPLAVVQILDRSVTLEMDLRLEAAAYSELSENIAGEADFRVPQVIWELTGRDVLVTEWVDGTKLRDRDAVLRAGHDGKRLATIVVQSFLRHALRDGFFHADMHEGNLFVDPDGRLVAVDLGIMGRIGVDERRFLAEILFGFIRRDYRRIAEVHIEAGYVPAIHSAEDFAQALRAIGEPIHGHRASDISMARLLGLLFEVTEIFDMQTRPELILLQKTMVVVEGVARRLDAEFDMWSTAEPVVRDWMERNLGPAAQVEKAAGGVGLGLRLLGQAPDAAARAIRLLGDLERTGRDGLRLHDDTVEALASRLARRERGLGVALWAVAVAVSVVAVAMLVRAF